MRKERERPLILMTGSVETDRDRGLRRAYYYENYAGALEAAGALVLHVGRCGEGEPERLAAMADALYLTGGGDVDPRLYGQEALPECGEADLDRDWLELALGRAFLALGKPILGICRGLQVLNVLLGGTLWQDLPSQTGRPHPNAETHPVRTAESSLLRELFGRSFSVNSYHHQAVRDLAPCLTPMAWSEPEGFVEAFAHEGLPVWAVQWHPERMTGEGRYDPEGPDMAPLFRRFVRAAER